MVGSILNWKKETDLWKPNQSQTGPPSILSRMHTRCHPINRWGRVRDRNEFAVVKSGQEQLCDIGKGSFPVFRLRWSGVGVVLGAHTFRAFSYFSLIGSSPYSKIAATPMARTKSSEEYLIIFANTSSFSCTYCFGLRSIPVLDILHLQHGELGKYGLRA